MTDHLLRSRAPITDRAWAGMGDDVTPKLTVQLAARRLVDFRGPTGWETSAHDTGHIDPIASLAPDVEAHVRRVLPLVELRVGFALSRRQLEDFDRGAVDVPLDPLDDAARTLALAENRAVLQGYGAAGIRGIVEASGHEAIPLGPQPDDYPKAVARAVDALRSAGIDGPYGLAIAPAIHTGIAETAEHGGYPLFDHLGEILGGPVVWAPGIEGGVVISQRGGDFAFESGQDISIGYLGHDDELVRLYLEESFTFHVDEPDAAVGLVVPT